MRKIRTYHGTIGVHCNSGASKNSTIVNIVVLKGDPAFIRSSGLANFLSLVRVTIHCCVTFDNRNVNYFTVRINGNQTIIFKCFRRRLY